MISAIRPHARIIDGNRVEVNNQPAKVQEIIKQATREISKADIRVQKRFTKRMLGALTFPTIGFQGWESAYPIKIKDNLVLERLIQLIKSPEDFDYYATDIEAMGYISTMSLAAPLRQFNPEFNDIYSYLFTKYAKRMKLPMPDGVKVLNKLSSYQMGVLNQLKKRIRRSQWRAIGGKL
jgi:hypothetical protein